MDEEKSKQMPIPSNDSRRTIEVQSNNVVVRPVKLLQQRIVQNFLIVWVDPTIDESNKDCQNSISQLRRIINTIYLFTEIDECVDFLSEIHDEKVLMIVYCTFAEQILPCINDMQQLDSIYILCNNKAQHDQWIADWSKVKSVFTQINQIYESLKQGARRCDQDSISFSIISTNEVANKNLDQLDSLFMYTQLFKEIVLETEYGEQDIIEFAEYYRNINVNNDHVSNNVDTFKLEYHVRSPIWWYTSQSFLYPMLNRALHLQEVDTIIKIGFFIKDLYRHIEQLHSAQKDALQGWLFTVYRGQVMTTVDFEKVHKTKGGLISFNQFLPTSIDRDVSIMFAESNPKQLNTIGILFEITIDHSISSVSYASIDKVSRFQEEKEILFSMHTVFRIGEIKQIGNNERLWQVNLKLTADDDELLGALTERMREETRGPTGWYRLGTLLAKLNQFDKAEKVYMLLLDSKSNDAIKGSLYNQLGYIKHCQSDHRMAIMFYEKSFQIFQETLSSDHPDLATFHNNIGLVYENMGEYSKALSFYEKAVDIYHKTLP
ncbi:unnamed protein product [Rotaria magnacalcarata]|uniref:ADP ribosyltransferase domain-containing protein n=2 Tax=Rotaria TaxID=231623 RepID=A0A817AKE8_9BILA|nr:unnamed protein product [Rotaria magnacalcarata]CAF3619792.1 unnamed protein product [Rotaria socialis]CAF3819569.1 unnamed protein product [Rotaria magnacalcarata]CAF4518361.1 unnamed protein product [Rotaria socialis]